MIHKKRCRSSMRFRRCKVNVDGLDSGQIAWLRIAATMTGQSDGLRHRAIRPLVAMRRTAHGSGLGRWSWVIERTFAWLNQFRRLRLRYDKRADIHGAVLSLG